MRVPFRLVDVFADAPFGGNQLCVVPEASDRISTTRRCRPSRGRSGSPRPPSSRPFAPAVTTSGSSRRRSELPVRGPPDPRHGVRRSRESGCSAPRRSRRCAAGDIPVEVDLDGGRATMRQLPPVFGRAGRRSDGGCAAAGLEPDDLGRRLPIVPVSTGISHLMVPIAGRRTRSGARRVTIAGARGVRVSRQAGVALPLRGPGPRRRPSRGCSTGSRRSGRTRRPDRRQGRSAAYLATHGLAGMPGHGTDRTGRADRTAVVPARGGRSRRRRVGRCTSAGASDRWATGAFEL